MSENQNRAFMYGESVFTTLRMKNGSLIDWEHHFERLRRGVEFVYGPFTDGEPWSVIFKGLLESKLQLDSGEKIARITVYREQARGLVKSSLISVTDLKIHVAVSVFDSSRSMGSVKLRTCPANFRPSWWPSFLKAGNYLETILAQRLYLKEQDDDLLFYSGEETILESSVANIFVIRHNILYTAPTGPNVLEGIMRRNVLEVAKDYFDDVVETGTTLDQLFKADAIFGTNSLRGIFLVDRIDEYELNYNQDFLKKIESLKARVFQ